MKAPEEPRPVPEGMSAIETISMPGLELVASKISRTIAVLDLVDRRARSSWEYLSR